MCGVMTDLPAIAARLRSKSPLTRAQASHLPRRVMLSHTAQRVRAGRVAMEAVFPGGGHPTLPGVYALLCRAGTAVSTLAARPLTWHGWWRSASAHILAEPDAGPPMPPSALTCSVSRP